jgi:hypothetical protein
MKRLYYSISSISKRIRSQRALEVYIHIKEAKSEICLIFPSYKSNVFVEIYSILFKFVCYRRDFSNSVRFKPEVLLVKHAKQNQTTYYVRYNRAFVKTVIIITEFYSIHNLLLVRLH